MTSEKTIEAHYERERLRRKAAARPPADGATPQQKLVRAAETGRFEAIVAAAQPAEPPKMMTPEEREAELRRAVDTSHRMSSPRASYARGEGGDPRLRGEGEVSEVFAFPHPRRL
jgi:acyl-CoA reductase-like NAD-dependent aldehyde dehydrogenase